MSECRICFDGVDTTRGELISPCQCSGSQNYIHEQCLQRWRDENRNSSSRDTCEICRADFHIVQDHPKEVSFIRIYNGPWVLPIVYMYGSCGLLGSLLGLWDSQNGYMSIHFITPSRFNRKLIRLVQHDSSLAVTYYTSLVNWALTMVYLAGFGITRRCYVRRYGRYWRCFLPSYLTHCLLGSYFIILLYISCLTGGMEIIQVTLGFLFMLMMSTAPLIELMHQQHNKILHRMNDDPNHERVLSIEDRV